MINNLKKAQKILRKYNQEHLLYFLNELEEKEKGSLIQQILNTDFKKIENLYIKSFEDDTIETRKKLYTEEAQKYFDGNVYIPDDLEEINLI